MGDLKQGEPFGLDPKYIKSTDWYLAVQRVLQDLRSDFIYAPHLALIYARCAETLIANLKAELRAGKYSPALPITIEVPKSFRMRVAVTPKRLGPSFSRPGSILLPKDRVLYQALADQAASIVEAKTDKERSFSHRLTEDGSPHMFLPTRVSWGALQKALSKYAKVKGVRYILRLDVADFFGSINQHTLVNTLEDAGYPGPLASRLEAVLTAFTGERSSRGILQGMFPSDLFGNFYMSPIDRFLDEAEVASARYVDDVYVFLESVDAADRLLRSLTPELRSYDLVLNEAKSLVMPKSALITEEPDLEELFDDAVAEIKDQLSDDDFDADYGFQSEWEEEDESEEEEEVTSSLELAATKLLFDSMGEYPGQEENIERFCLPLFSKAKSDHAVLSVLDAFKKRPSMGQIYTSYLSNFLDESEVYEELVSLAADSSLTDWQRMWVIAALLKRPTFTAEAVKAVWAISKDPNRHDAVRAVACVFVGRFGDAPRRKALGTLYKSVSPYVQAAIYYSSRTWPSVERSNAKATWGSQGELNSLLTTAMAKSSQLAAKGVG